MVTLIVNVLLLVLSLGALAYLQTKKGKWLKAKFWIEFYGWLKGYNSTNVSYHQSHLTNESGNGASRLAYQYNNYSGMGVPSKRVQPKGTHVIDIGSNLPNDPVRKYSAYTSVRKGILDYFNYLEQVGYKKDYPNIGEFVDALNRSGYSVAMQKKPQLYKDNYTAIINRDKLPTNYKFIVVFFLAIAFYMLYVLLNFLYRLLKPLKRKR